MAEVLAHTAPEIEQVEGGGGDVRAADFEDKLLAKQAAECAAGGDGIEVGGDAVGQHGDRVVDRRPLSRGQVEVSEQRAPGLVVASRELGLDLRLHGDGDLVNLLEEVNVVIGVAEHVAELVCRRGRGERDRTGPQPLPSAIGWQDAELGVEETHRLRVVVGGLPIERDPHG